MMLGEARSKCEHIAQVPLQPGTAERLHQLYLAKGALATTAIEGNTLSEEEVVKHLEGKLRLPPSKQYLAKEIDNVVEACNWILGEIVDGQSPRLTATLIKDFNHRVLKGLKLAEDVVPGEIRSHAVGVARYRAVPPEDCDFLLDRTCDWLNGQGFTPTANELSDEDLSVAILKAVIAHLYLAWIHPFGDGNGRTARLIEFLILVTSGVPSDAAHLLSNHYNQTRTEYYRQLDRASMSGGDIMPFLEYAVEGSVDGLRAQLGLVRGQQLRTIWRDYVYGQFHDRNSKADTRRRHLVLDISERDEPVAVNKLREVSPRVAEGYAGKSSKTLFRDLKLLKEMSLIQVDEQGVQARRDLILSFLPVGQIPKTPKFILSPNKSVPRSHKTQGGQVI